MVQSFGKQFGSLQNKRAITVQMSNCIPGHLSLKNAEYSFKGKLCKGYLKFPYFL